MGRETHVVFPADPHHARFMSRAILIFVMTLALVVAGGTPMATAGPAAGMSMDMPGGDLDGKPCPACDVADANAMSCLQICAAPAAMAVLVDLAKLPVMATGAVAPPLAVAAPVGSGRAPEPPPPRLSA
ncbi:MAG: hypothetical protein EPN20_17625 [Magnetospirillum sp.]|nr:MAG: hypothetical protein EPN20_17625 [Magnetospirillum sp.]